MARKMEMHDFYCMKCGNKTFSIPRPVSHQYKKHHRKKLFCPVCNRTVNCIECRSDSEVYEFKELFEEGAFIQEVEESMAYIDNEEKIWS